ncbi:glycosyltransferase family 4 protein [Anaerosacchariphilus polymeriproducens]|nr:glycosyltransferase [Anaerosacchariphilus polymeriproducens]
MEQTKKLLEIISEEITQYEDYVSEKLQMLFLELDEKVSELAQGEKDWVEQQIKNLIESNFLYKRIYLNSVLMQMFGKVEYLEEIAGLALTNSKIRPATKYFLSNKLFACLILNEKLGTENARYLLWKLSQQSCNEYENYLELELNPIPKEERNPNLILVITDHFVHVSHAPTKTALDRCAMIKKKLHKECLLIHTTEGVTREGEIPFLIRAIPGYTLETCFNDEHSKKEYQEWNGVKIPFVQSERNMPNPIDVKVLIDTIKQLKPLFIIDIGTASMVANLSSKLVPVLGLNLCFSELAFTTETYQALGRKLNDKDLALLRKLDIPKSHVIESTFTFSFVPQKQNLTREQIGFGENEFIIAVVGFRLDIEVTSEFIVMLESVLNENIKIAFIGVFKEYEKFEERHPILKTNAYNVGYQEDILSVIEHCNLFVNPIRKGGGSSCVEAMSKGLPVVTTKHGDVAANVGEMFCVNDYNEMREQINKYYQDSEFYNEMSGKALERASILQDTDHAFYQIMNEMCQREGMTLD